MSIYTTAGGTIIVSGAHPLVTDISYSLLRQQPSWLAYEEPIKLNQFQIPDTQSIQREFTALNAATMTDYHIRNLRTDFSSNFNRYSDVLPFTHSNVTLNTAPQYINASWVSGIEFPLQRQLFIATQGPLPNTINHFWAMIFEQNVETIVMLCNVQEQNSIKCEQYWPSSMSKTKVGFGRIWNKEPESDFGSYTVRTLEIQPHEGERRIVKQIHYKDWPDHGVPQDLRGLDQIIDLTKERNQPIAVHCSAGVGRTGSFIAMYNIKHAIINGVSELSVFSIVRRLREQRIMMVQTQQQYLMLYEYLGSLLGQSQLINMSSILEILKQQKDKTLVLEDLVQFLAESDQVEITFKSIQKIGGLVNPENRKLFLQLAQVYLLLSNYALQPENSLAMIDDLIRLSGYLQGSDISIKLGNCAKRLLVHHMQEGGLSEIQLEAVRGLIEAYKLKDITNEVIPLLDRIKKEDYESVNQLMYLFSSFTTYKEQLEQFQAYSNQIIDSVKGLSNRNVLARMVKFLEHFVYCNKLPLLDANQNVQIYRIKDDQTLQQYEDILYVAQSLIRIFLDSEPIIQQVAISFLARLWSLFPDRHDLIYKDIYKSLKAVAANGTDAFMELAARFMYSIIHDSKVPGFFKGWLENDKVLQKLFYHKGYRAPLHGCFLETETTTSQDMLQLEIGFPQTIFVPAGGSAFLVIHNDKAGNVLQFAFATEEYDISFILTRVDTDETQELINLERIDCSEQPQVGVLILQEAGLYHVLWDNTYSWFRQKHVRYRFTLLEQIYIHNPIKEPQKPVFSSKTEAEFDIIMSLVIRDEDILLDINGEGSTIEETEDIAESIRNLINQQSDSLLVQVISITPPPYQLFSPQIQSVQARDVDAIAMHAHLQLDIQSVVAIAFDSTPRSAMVMSGKLMLDQDNNPICDVGNLPNPEIYSSVAWILRIFSPQCVCIMSNESFNIDKLKDHIPLSVMQNTEIRQIGEEELMAAAIALDACYKKFKVWF